MTERTTDLLPGDQVVVLRFQGDDFVAFTFGHEQDQMQEAEKETMFLLGVGLVELALHQDDIVFDAGAAVMAGGGDDDDSDAGSTVSLAQMEPQGNC